MKSPLKLMSAPIVAITLLVSAVPAQAGPSIVPPQAKRSAEANNAFGLSLYKTVAAETLKKNKNVFFSPLSASMAFSLLYNGANGHTRELLGEKLYGRGNNLAAFNKGQSELLKVLQSKESEFELSLANSVFVDRTVRLRQSYARQMSTQYSGRVDTLDFLSPYSAKTINSWVKKETREKISEIVTPQVLREAVMVLANATYFKADWSLPFPAYMTSESGFVTLDQRRVRVPYMQNEASYRYLRGLDFEAIELPYGRNGEISMTVVLPRDLEDFTRKIGVASLDQLSKRLEAEPLRFGALRMPKFKFTTDISLNSALGAMGLGAIFKRGADFTAMASDEELVVTNALQKSFVAVDEKGTEAAAVTGIIVGLTSAPPPPAFRMNVERPFVAFIREKSTGAILFIGAIVNPALEN